MKRSVGLSLIVTVVLVVSGCVPARQVEFQASPSEAERYKSLLKINHDNYGTCLYASAVAIRSVLKIPVNRQKVISDCEQYRAEYYKSVFYSAFGGYQNRSFSDEFRHNTARSAVSNTESSAFRTAEEVHIQ